MPTTEKTPATPRRRAAAAEAPTETLRIQVIRPWMATFRAPMIALVWILVLLFLESAVHTMVKGW